MDESFENIEGLSEDLNSLQQMMIENTLLIRKRMASALNPIITLTAIVSIVVLGLLLNISSTIVNVIVALSLIFIVGGLFTLRYFFYVRSTDNVVEYLSTGKPLKKGAAIPYLEKIFTFLSPQEIYNSAKELVDEEWVELFPIFEEELEKIRISTDEPV